MMNLEVFKVGESNDNVELVEIWSEKVNFGCLVNLCQHWERFLIYVKLRMLVINWDETRPYD